MSPPPALGASAGPNADSLSVSPVAWIALVAVILAVVLADLLVVHREARVMAFRDAAVASAVYLALGLAFGAAVWASLGSGAAVAYYAGFVVEKSLSIDNVFVWAVIFRFFGTPPEHQRRVLFWGVLGALTMRALFIFAGAALLERFEWTAFVLGSVLFASGVQLVRHRGRHGDIDLERNPVMRLAGRLPATDRYHEGRFFVREHGRRVATPLLLALVAVEATDLVFALDSVPAILAITTNTWIVFAANAFALLGLRALYFLLADFVRRFAYLDLGLAIVLIFVAAKMYYQALSGQEIPVGISLSVILAIVGGAVAASWWRTRGNDRPPAAGSPVARGAASSG
jgi:tellurite resistance protein TerC